MHSAFLLATLLLVNSRRAATATPQLYGALLAGMVLEWICGQFGLIAASELSRSITGIAGGIGVAGLRHQYVTIQNQFTAKALLVSVAVVVMLLLAGHAPAAFAVIVCTNGLLALITFWIRFSSLSHKGSVYETQRIIS